MEEKLIIGGEMMTKVLFIINYFLKIYIFSNFTIKLLKAHQQENLLRKAENELRQRQIQEAQLARYL